MLRSGYSAGWSDGVANGHCLVNRSNRDAVFLEVGSRAQAEKVTYSDIDMLFERGDKNRRYLHRNGEPYV